MTKITPVILSGGQGSRLWPLSSPELPKQFGPLFSGESLFSQTLSRVGDRSVFTQAVIACAAQHVSCVEEILVRHGIRDAILVSEPVGRNTAPAIYAGLLAARTIDEDAVCLVLPADHHIPETDKFQETVATAVENARQGYIATFGIVPRGPHTAYGYIEAGEALATGFKIASFKEKPDARTALAYVESGRYLWNSGIFMLNAPGTISVFQKLQPAIAAFAQAAWDDARKKGSVIALDAAAFSQCPNISFDYAVMEKAPKACVIQAPLRWDDLGSWNALWDHAAKDENRNFTDGSVLTVNTSGSYLRSHDKILCAAGVEDMIVISIGDYVLVTPRDKPEQMTALIHELKKRNAQGIAPAMTGT